MTATRPAYVQDMAKLPQVFVVEQTDIPIAGNLRSNIVETLKQVWTQRPEELAHEIKDRLDDNFGSNWHVVVGTDYACVMNFTPGSFMRVNIGEFAIQIYRLG